MIRLVPAFLLGILLVQQCPGLPPPWTCWGLAVVAVGLLWRRWRVAAFFCFGVAYMLWQTDARLAAQLPTALANAEMVVTGRVLDVPERNGDSIRFDLAVDEAPGNFLRKLRLTWLNPGLAVKAGQQWRLAVKLKPPRGTLNPAGFDYGGWLFSQGIGATGQVRPYPKPVLLGEARWAWLAACRQHIFDRLAALPLPPETIALLQALTIGVGSGISPADWEVFRKTGTTHLLVISGSHIALIAGMVWALVRRLWVRLGVLALSPPVVAAWAALLAGIGYAGLAGFSVPTQRAVVMLAVLMGAVIWQRPLRPFHALALALFAVLLYDPLAVMQPGFWLSFVAVALIAYSVTGRLGKMPLWRETLQIQWVTSLGLSPLLLWFFQQVSLCAPLANLLAVPLVGVLVPLALFATGLLYVYPSLGLAMMGGLAWLLQQLLWLLAYLATLPWASIHHPQPSFWALGLSIPGVLWVLAPRGVPGRYLGAVLLVPLALPVKNRPPPGEWQLTMLDVGQGLALVVQTANHWLVYDTGGKFSEFSDSGGQIVLPFLYQQGVAQLDTLVVSHGDLDHIGGAASLLRGMPTARVLTSVPQQLAEFVPDTCRAGQTWRWEGVDFAILSPSDPVFKSDNNNSCVLKISSPNGTALLTGDIETAAEIRLVNRYREQLRADVLVAPHHGSKTSSSYSLVQTVWPETVLIPAGWFNPFGHPHAQSLARYREVGAHWWNTADNGAVTVRFADGKRQVTGMRQQLPRYWYPR